MDSDRLATTRPGVDFKALVRKLADSLAEIEHFEDSEEMLESVLEGLLSRFRQELGFEGGRIYRREGDDYFLCCGFGRSRDAPIGLKVPRDYPPHRHLLSDGIVLMRRAEPGVDPAFEDAIGAPDTFAAIGVGDGPRHIIAFSIHGDAHEEQLLYSLTAVRHVLNFKLREQRTFRLLEESRVAHEHILPCCPPDLAGWDIHGRTRAAERFGGDVFDWLPLPGDRLGIMIADSSGHGLPASFLARDVVTGLRMAIEGTTAPAPVVERLNRVIHRAAGSISFVTMFLGVIDREGMLTYCNAGHDPPLLRRGDAFEPLERGGTVLGALPAATYKSDTVRLDPGDGLTLYTDGLVERPDRAGERFGVDRLRRKLRELRDASALDTVEAVLAAADAHGGSGALPDDVTVLVARKL